MSDDIISDNRPRFFMYASALMCDRPILDLTQGLDDGSTEYYGGRYFVCETLSEKAGKIIAEALGGVFR